MESLDKAAILDKTHYGLNIYAHILQMYYPGQTVLSISGRTCAPARNPFNNNKQTILIWIENNRAMHHDTENIISDGDAFGFAELHYKQSGDELLQTINKEMNLRIGEKFDFYKNRNANIQITIPGTQRFPESYNQDNQNNHVNHSSDIGEASFSFFKAPVSNTTPHSRTNLLQVFNAIKGDYYKERTVTLRAFTNSKLARQYKAQQFDYCTFSGVFTTRNDKALVKHSGLLVVDFDHLPNLETIRRALLADEYFDTQLLFTSPSGDGLKWVIQISPPSGDLGGFSHAEYFAAVSNYIRQVYGIEVDKSGKDVSRACFLPYDPDAFINPLIVK